MRVLQDLGKTNIYDYLTPSVCPILKTSERRAPPAFVFKQEEVAGCWNQSSSFRLLVELCGEKKILLPRSTSSIQLIRFVVKVWFVFVVLALKFPGVLWLFSLAILVVTPYLSPCVCHFRKRQNDEYQFLSFINILIHHRFSVTFCTLGFRLFLIQLQINNIPQQIFEDKLHNHAVLM
jgi:hypothetical protein